MKSRLPALAIILFLLSACGGTAPAPTPTPTLTASPPNTSTPEISPTLTPSPLNTSTPEPSPTPDVYPGLAPDFTQFTHIDRSSIASLIQMAEAQNASTPFFVPEDPSVYVASTTIGLALFCPPGACKIVYSVTTEDHTPNYQNAPDYTVIMAFNNTANDPSHLVVFAPVVIGTRSGSIQLDGVTALRVLQTGSYRFTIVVLPEGLFSDRTPVHWVTDQLSPATRQQLQNWMLQRKLGTIYEPVWGNQVAH